MTKRAVPLVRPRILGIALMVVGLAAAPAFACPRFSVRQTGNARNLDLNEVSGIVVSRHAIWMEEDSAGAPAVYAARRSGGNLGKWTIRGATNIDWEDLSFGPSHDLFVGDIGNNSLSRSSVQIYRVNVPHGQPGTVKLKHRYSMTYRDGHHNAEAMFVHRRRVFIITKDGNGGIYRARLGDRVLRRVGTLGMSTVTAADMRHGHIIVQSYTTSWWFKVRGSILSTLRGSHCSVPNTGGESVGLRPNLSGYYMIPEGSRPPIHYAFR